MHITIIGLGGVGSIVALRLGYQYDTHLIDFDDFEEGNSHRQMLALQYPKRNKAEAHQAFIDEMNENKKTPPHCTSKNEKITDETPIPLTDLIICLVDNNAARNAVRKHAIRSQTPLIIAANEAFDSEASMLLPSWEDTDLDPWVTWPALYDESTPDEKPIHCTDPRIEVTAPQTPLANFMAASGAVLLAEGFIMRKCIVEQFDIVRFASTQTRISSKRPFDLIGEEKWRELEKQQ